MKKDIISFAIALLLSIAINAQSNIVQEGKWIVVSGNDTISSHSTKDNAIESMLNQKLKGNNDVRILVPSIRVDLDKNFQTVIRDTVYVEVPDIRIVSPPPVTDTINVTTCFTTGEKLWLHTSDQNIWPHDIYIPFEETSLTRVTFDTLTQGQKIYQTKFKLERTKNFSNAVTTYKNLQQIPIQVYIKDSVVSIEPTKIVVRAFASGDWGLKTYVNGTLHVDGLEGYTPGNVIIEGVKMRRHTINFVDLQPNTEYELKVEAYARNGYKFDTITYNLKTTQ